MNFKEFFKEARENRIKVEFDNPDLMVKHRLSNEALFHLPLIAMTILLLSKSLRKPKIDELGQLIGECFERSFQGFKGSSQHLGWSANLRMRTVKALTFLETANLVRVDKTDSRIKASILGKKVISRALEGETDLALNLLIIERKYRDIQTEKQISLEL